jgi:hypothetical protein
MTKHSSAHAMIPTSDEVRALGASLITPELVLFPVRHHSPACALHLQRWLASMRPSAVLVEGPRGFDPLIPLLVHDEARMPLAVYTYAVFMDASTNTNDAEAEPGTPAEKASVARRSAYYPFCDHSPELVALRAAHMQGIPVRFIDLNFAEQCQLESEDEDSEAHSLLDERHFQRSRYLTALASQLGCRHHEELWEHLFEAPATARTFDEHVIDMAAYCHLARLECTDEELTADGTLAREAEMAWHIQQALGRRQPSDGPVLVVIGGFHAVALPGQLKQAKIKRPVIKGRAVSDEASALIRYSQDRLDRLNGYASGMTSPAWQQQLWERVLRYEKASSNTEGMQHISTRVRQELALTTLFDIAIELRTRHNIALPMPALAAAYEQVLQLAILRNRPAPVREDVFDAVTSCFVKGDADADGALVLSIARRLLSGQQMGRVPPGASTPPLVRDFEYRARRQRLKIDDSEPKRAVLDIYRRPEHRTTSRLFHGLNMLGVPLAYRTAGPDFVNGFGLDRLQEHWEYTHTAATEAALVEASVYGTTVPLAVAARFGEHLDRFESGAEPRHAKAAAAMLSDACVLGLHDHVPKVAALLASVIAADAEFASVAVATGTLGLLWESREPLEARGVLELPQLLNASYERAIYLGRSLKGANDGGSEVVAGLARLRELLTSEVGQRLDASLFWALVDELIAQNESAFVRGAAAGLAYGAGRLDETALSALVDGHLAGLTNTEAAVSFLRGLLHTAREAAWQQPSLLQVLDRLLANWQETEFVTNLPELRLAFAEMTPKETDRIAEAVAALHGKEDLGRLVRYDVSAAQVQAHLAVATRLQDVLAADGFAAWFAESKAVNA